VTHGQCDARPTVTFPTAGHHHRPLIATKLYCLMTEAHVCVWTTCPRLLPERARPGVEPTTFCVASQGLPEEAPEIFLSVSENKSSDRKLSLSNSVHVGRLLCRMAISWSVCHKSVFYQKKERGIGTSFGQSHTAF